ncbi:MAG: hypothetical protein KY466_00500 [Gemmatimonadetes bacterium]|nr:hypothetical protein [Gemmatimonadota bacterium]
MAGTRSRCCRAPTRPGRLAALVAGVLCALPAAAAAQDDDADSVCRSLQSPSAVSECRLSVGAARMIQPRMAAALFGGNPVPGTASTLGMRLGSLPRMSLAFRVTGAPAERPPILDRTVSDGSRSLLVGLTADAALGVLTGLSPLPTVGGVLSLDLIARAAFLPLPASEGFHDGAAWGLAAGARLGAVRESFTLPGISITGTYGRITRTAFGDPDTGTTDGFFEGAVTDLRIEVAATKRLGLIGLTAGAAHDRYSSDLTAGFRDGLLGQRLEVSGDAVHGRWSAYGDAAWTLLIFQAALEVGWQDAPVPDGLPSSVDLDPVGWFGGLSFRISI